MANAASSGEFINGEGPEAASASNQDLPDVHTYEDKVVTAVDITEAITSLQDNLSDVVLGAGGGVPVQRVIMVMMMSE
jgi:hypothetical protein